MGFLDKQRTFRMHSMPLLWGLEGCPQENFKIGYDIEFVRNFDYIDKLHAL